MRNNVQAQLHELRLGSRYQRIHIVGVLGGSVAVMVVT